MMELFARGVMPHFREDSCIQTGLSFRTVTLGPVSDARISKNSP